MERFRRKRNKAKLVVNKSVFNDDIEVSQAIIPALVSEFVRQHGHPQFEATTITFKIDRHSLVGTIEELE